MDRKTHWGGSAVLGASCASIFWPGAFIFALPGILGPYWQDQLHVGRAAIGRSLFFVLAGVGLFMFLTGRFQERYGPRPLVFLGALICGGSTILAGHAPSIAWIYVWAFMMGVSSSLVYIPTLTVVQKWYPARRGLVSGLVNMSFGFSAAIMSPLFSWSLARLGVAAMTLLFGLCALIFGLLSAGFVRSPQEPSIAASGALSSHPPDVSPDESLRTSAFWLIWFTWVFAGAGGISMVTLSTSFGLAQGLAMGEAILILTAFNVTNGLSRLLSGYLSDRVGRNLTMTVAFLGAGSAYLLMSCVHHLWAWAILASIVGFAFGTLFAVSGPLISDCFGLKHFGTIFGLIFTAYGFFSGAFGPWLSGHVLDHTEGNFKVVFFYLGAGFLLAALLIWFARPRRA
jgi:MFS transporter, OFA family, oxalate/formate antiporter